MSDTLGSYNYTSEHISFIQQEIKNYLECDDVLSEYIIVMVRNNKTKKEISGDLADFLSSDAEAFVNWLWNFIRTYFVQKESTPIAGGSTDQSSKKPTSRLLANAVRQATEDTKNAIPAGDIEFQDSQDSDPSDVNGGYKKRNNNYNKNINNNSYNNSNNNKPSKYSHSNTNKSTSSPPSSLKVTFSTSPSDNRKRKINTSIDEDLINNSNSASVATEEDADESETIRNTKKTDKKERCTYWPQCKNGDSCPRYHPTIQCNLFPKCPYGEKCLYIHPSIPCKFGPTCANFSCPYNHPQRTMHAFEHAPVPCRNGFACPNKKFCSFSHPPIACKYGESCAFGKKCTFSHGKPCMYGVSCTTPNCTFSHNPSTDVNPTFIQKECKFAKECTNVNCKYLHPERENTDALSSTLPSTPPAQEDAIITDAIETVPEVSN
ncbi:hypothetical protein PPL_01580 [Heterostelium album PN500]|uniref:Zinc finger CCCH domain-containing protein 14 n=1 Tax=Heterostelium pallidum (strain ATCC 26659 / Pp 5 / PN500) TaxID=670386 RepID=D3AZW6_HETP5|nr:hypothetical protein PPL_01580 [Heterostelium album PN500]EFA84590.1 hypothetical protein PPL_01580 [Heterostelium album PN500]|eukprot:XP_020436703.1 hypothetical protein PPL_01580 [Heterostelium album PN500]